MHCVLDRKKMSRDMNVSKVLIPTNSQWKNLFSVSYPKGELNYFKKLSLRCMETSFFSYKERKIKVNSGR